MVVAVVVVVVTTLEDHQCLAHLTFADRLLLRRYIRQAAHEHSHHSHSETEIRACAAPSSDAQL